MDIVEVLSNKYSQYIWHINDVYETLIWDESNDIPKPTLDDLEKAWTDMKTEKPYEKLRTIRNFLLSKTDYMFMSDYHLPIDIKEKWIAYRQALRDLPQTTVPSLDENGNLVNVTFPISPQNP